MTEGKHFTIMLSSRELDTSYRKIQVFHLVFSDHPQENITFL